MAKIPAVIRQAKVTNELDMTHLRRATMIHKSEFLLPLFLVFFPSLLIPLSCSLLDQLQLCVETLSLQNLLSLFTPFPKHAERFPKSGKSGGGDGGRGQSTSRAIVTSNGGGGNISGDKRKVEGVKSPGSNDSRNRGGHDGGTRGGNDGGIRCGANNRSSSLGGSIINNSG